MKQFIGVRFAGGTDVTVYTGLGAAGSNTVQLPHRRDLVDHSPTGFEWGYYGSGPAQLALALVSGVLGREADLRALAAYQTVHLLIVARLPRAGWTIDASEIRIAVLEAEAEQLARERSRS